VAYTLVPGSGAIWSGTQGPPDASSVGLAAVSGLGSAAWQKCSDLGEGSECIVYVLVGHSWLELFYGSGVPITADSFDTFAKGVVAGLH
jgi:hypothetical protein